jgi:hypothetical protein
MPGPTLDGRSRGPVKSGSDDAVSMPKVIRPRHEFPTPLFKLTMVLLAAAAVALIVWLVVGAR